MHYLLLQLRHRIFKTERAHFKTERKSLSSGAHLERCLLSVDTDQEEVETVSCVLWRNALLHPWVWRLSVPLAAGEFSRVPGLKYVTELFLLFWGSFYMVAESFAKRCHVGSQEWCAIWHQGFSGNYLPNTYEREDIAPLPMRKLRPWGRGWPDFPAHGALWELVFCLVSTCLICQ